MYFVFISSIPKSDVELKIVNRLKDVKDSKANDNA